jgi:magnesium-transporting ATPase (P-type)
MSVEESLASLGSVETGLTEAEVEKRLKLYGKNTFKKTRNKARSLYSSNNF